MKKHQRESRQSKFWKHTRAICNLNSCYNFAIVLHENALVFQLMRSALFFMYIIMRLGVSKELSRQYTTIVTPHSIRLFTIYHGTDGERRSQSDCRMSKRISRFILMNIACLLLFSPDHARLCSFSALFTGYEQYR